MDDISPNKILQNHSCIYCNYNTCSKKDYIKHLSTRKHKRMTKELQKDYEIIPHEHFVCDCGSKYKYRQGLWKHKKNCNKKEVPEEECNTQIKYNPDINNVKELTNLVLEIVKSNNELQKQMLDICKNANNNSTNITNNNCNNKTFNLQVFLNETCKDAMNIMEFVDSIQLQLSDLESVGELGYVKGLSNIIVKNLRALDVTKRPVHCSDAKREILYVKDNDVWEKEDVENPKMKKAVKYIAYKNTKLLPLWKQTYPECMQFDSSKNDKYNYMVIEAMGGMGDHESEKINKIIKQIAKEVVIEK
jgi:hypothetical protein